MTAALSTVQRGYGAAHRNERNRWVPLVAAGRVACYRCGLLIPPGAPWDLGHTDDRRGWTGPEHRHCNRKHGSKIGHQRRWGMRLQRSRRW